MAEPAKQTRETRFAGRYPVETAFRTDKGAVRESNEDAAAIVNPADAEVLENKGILALVADGMGGHEGGEIASRAVVDLIPEIYYGRKGSTQDLLVEAVREANRAVYALARANRKLAGMGTTCTALVLREGFGYAAHVGDSRIYLLRAGCAYRMTEDHSATMQMVNQGLLTLAQASRHEDRNVILRAVGTQEKIEAAVWRSPFPVRAGDLFLLCSDGLHESLPDDEIAAVCSRKESVPAICDALIGAALDRRCSDNVTVAVLRIGNGGNPA